MSGVSVFQMEDLSNRLMSKQDELVERQRKFMEITDSLRKKEDEIKKLENK